MSSIEPTKRYDRVTEAIVNSLVELFADPEFDSDEGVIRFLDHDESCVRLGLFPTDENGDVTSRTPAVTWTVEVSNDAKVADR